MARNFTRASSHFLKNSSAIVTSYPFTLAAWFNSQDTTNSQDIFMIGKDSAPEAGWRLNAGGNAAGDPIRAINRASSNFYIAVTSTGYTANTWYHACGVWASSTSRAVYINGGSKGTNITDNTPSGVNNTNIGRADEGTIPANYFDGQIAEVAAWNVDLSDAEVEILGKGYSPLFIRPQSLIFYCPLIGRYSPEIDI